MLKSIFLNKHTAGFHLDMCHKTVKSDPDWI